jgi:hypothetical protein
MRVLRWIALGFAVAGCAPEYEYVPVTVAVNGAASYPVTAGGYNGAATYPVAPSDLPGQSWRLLRG